MAKIQTVQCDSCGIIKQSVNHWYLGYATEEGISIHPAKEEIEISDADLCSDACVVKYVQKWMSSQKEAAVESSTGE